MPDDKDDKDDDDDDDDDTYNYEGDAQRGLRPVTEDFNFDSGPGCLGDDEIEVTVTRS